jgi:hypothetical protein
LGCWRKEFGGLDFTNTRLMNQCLLSRWIVKLERGDTNMCSSLLRRKYLKDKGFFVLLQQGVPSFGGGLRDIKYTCQQDLKYLVDDERKIRFWEDVWLGECPLRIRFNELFEISREQRWVAARVLEGG